jgi:hypothetical protein
MVGWLMNDELERMWNDMDKCLGIFEDIRQERLRKAITNLYQDSRVPAEIRTKHILFTSGKRYLLNHLSRYCLGSQTYISTIRQSAFVI